MIGRLPYSLCVSGTEHEIRPDFRNIMAIIEAYEDEALPPEEKAFICLRRLYVEIPEDVQEAYEKALGFIDAGQRDDKPSPRLIDWQKDEHIIFPAINKVAGMELRTAEFVHWHTFVGYFMEVGEGVWSTVLAIRNKKARHKKLEKWEQEFLNANKELCTIGRAGTPKKESMLSMFEKLIEK